MTDKLHSNLGPSSADRWFNCPGSVALSAAAPKQKTSSHAAEGSVAHDLAEKLVTRKIDELELMAMIGKTVHQEGHEIEITDEMMDGAIEYRDIIAEDRKALMMAKRPAPIVGVAEKRVALKSVSEKLWGTLDYALYRKGHKLIIYDYKFGKGVAVDVEENKQLLIYLQGAMETFAGHAFDELEIVVIQPRAPHRDGIERRCPVKGEELNLFVNELKLAVAATQELEAKVEPGNWCRWCPAKVDCPALFNQIQKTAQNDFSIIPQDAGGVKALPDPTLMPIHKVSVALEWEGVINAWYETLKNRVREILESGGEVPGWKLVDGRSNRVWTSETVAVQTLSPLLGEDALYKKRTMKSPAMIEKLLTKKQFAEMKLTTKPPPKKAIAPMSDRRPPATTSAAEDFGVIKTKNGSEYTVGNSNEKDKARGDSPSPKTDDLEAELLGSRPGGVWPRD